MSRLGFERTVCECMGGGVVVRASFLKTRVGIFVDLEKMRKQNLDNVIKKNRYCIG